MLLFKYPQLEYAVAKLSRCGTSCLKFLVVFWEPSAFQSFIVIVHQRFHSALGHSSKWPRLTNRKVLLSSVWHVALVKNNLVAANMLNGYLRNFKLKMIVAVFEESHPTMVLILIQDISLRHADGGVD